LARLPRLRLFEEYEVSAIVELPRNDVSWEDCGARGGRSRAVLAKSGRVYDHRTWGQSRQKAIRRRGLRRHRVVNRKGDTDATVDLADVGKSVPFERRHDNARWNVAGRLGLGMKIKRQRHRRSAGPEVKKLSAGAAPIYLIDNRL
jgi:hypothetical protein